MMTTKPSRLPTIMPRMRVVAGRASPPRPSFNFAAPPPPRTNPFPPLLGTGPLSRTLQRNAAWQYNQMIAAEKARLQEEYAQAVADEQAKRAQMLHAAYDELRQIAARLLGQPAPTQEPDTTESNTEVDTMPSPYVRPRLQPSNPLARRLLPPDVQELGGGMPPEPMSPMAPAQPAPRQRPPMYGYGELFRHKEGKANAQLRAQRFHTDMMQTRMNIELLKQNLEAALQEQVATGQINELTNQYQMLVEMSNNLLKQFDRLGINRPTPIAPPAE